MSIRFCSSLFFVLVVVGFAFACNSSCDAHGTCNADDDTCVCDDGYYGIDCSEEGQTAEEGVQYSGSLRVTDWYFYAIEVAEDIGFNLNVSSSIGWVDVYVQVDTVPTKSNYYTKNQYRSSRYDIAVVTSQAGTWYVGMYGVTSSAYTFSFTFTSNCVDDCNGHGACVESVCQCESGWADDACSQSVTPLTLGVTVEGELTYDFAYYSLEIPTAVSEMIWTLENEHTLDRDSDLYIAFDRIPTLYDWDYREMSYNLLCSVSVEFPSTGSWYAGIYGYNNAEYALTVETFNYGCPNNCSYHGTCPDVVCSCDSGFSGDACEEMTEPLQSNVTVDGYVANSEWNYYYYSTFTVKNLMIELSQALSNQDCDVYIRKGAKPTQQLFDLQEVGEDQEFVMQIADPGEANWYIGVFGSSPCSYFLTAYETSDCLPTCATYGTCISGTCTCQDGWTGIDCTQPMVALSNGVTTSGAAGFNEWKYFSFKTTSSTVFVTVKELSGSGVLWLYSDETSFPSLYNFDTADKAADVYHRFEVSTPQAGVENTIYFGIFGSPNVPTLGGTSISFAIVAWAPPY